MYSREIAKHKESQKREANKMKGAICNTTIKLKEQNILTGLISFLDVLLQEMKKQEKKKQLVIPVISKMI